MQGRKYYQPKLFTTFQLSDKIPEDNFYRVIKDALDLEFLRKETQQYYGKCGQKSLDPVVFFKMSLVGYLENINSDRQLVEHCAMRLDILFFLDYDIDDALPWHSTLSRTRQLLGQEVFRKVFKMVLSLCIDKGMVAGRRQAIDSALIKANASMDSLMRREILDDVDTYSSELQQHEQKVKPLTSRQTKGINKSSGKHILGSFYAAKHLNNQTHYSATDPDAKVSFKPGKLRRLNYLSQVSVDTSNHVITHIQADFADKKDSQCLPEILKKAKENLTSNGLLLEQIICDANYSSLEVLKSLERLNISGFIPNFGGYKNKREGFTYHTAEDYYQCSQGIVLPFKKIVRTHRGNYFREYRSSNKDCKQCRLRHQCIGKSTQKQIRDSVDKHYFDQMHVKMKTPYAKYLIKLRQSTVEPVLGTLMEYGGIKKIRTIGIQQADKCMLLAAAAYNLKKWLRYTPRKVKSVAIAAKNRIDTALNFLLAEYLKKSSLRLVAPNSKPDYS